jgi:hypothetical protein
MLFEHVHLWEYRGMWELFPIIGHELLYMFTYGGGEGGGWKEINSLLLHRYAIHVPS